MLSTEFHSCNLPAWLRCRCPSNLKSESQVAIQPGFVAQADLRHEIGGTASHVLQPQLPQQRVTINPLRTTELKAHNAIFRNSCRSHHCIIPLMSSSRIC